MTGEHGTLIEVVYPGYAGTYFQPPEDAELVIWCPRCGKETDALCSETYPGETVEAWCQTGGHDVMVEVSQP